MKKNAQKNEDDLAKRLKLSTCACGFFFTKIVLSDFDDFDSDQISSKLAQRSALSMIPVAKRKSLI